MELTGAVAELIRETLRHDFRNINTQHIEILMIEGSERLLPMYPERLSRQAESALRRLGVTILINTHVKKISADSLQLSHHDKTSTLTASTVIWTAGVKPSSLSAVLEKTVTLSGMNTDVFLSSRIADYPVMTAFS